MSEQILLKSLTAGGTIAAHRFVEIDTKGEKVTQANSDGDPIIGVSDALTYKSGDRIDVGVIGIFDVEAGAAINAGVLVSSDADGKAKVAASGKTVAGMTLAKAAAGDIVKVLLTHGKY